MLELEQFCHHWKQLNKLFFVLPSKYFAKMESNWGSTFTELDLRYLDKRSFEGVKGIIWSIHNSRPKIYLGDKAEFLLLAKEGKKYLCNFDED